MRRLIAWSGFVALVVSTTLYLASLEATQTAGGPSAPAPSPPTPVADLPAEFAVAPSQRARAGETRADNGLGMVLAYCPPGTFRMGSPIDEPDRHPNEGPVRVTLTHGYWLGTREVTQAQFRAVTGRSHDELRARAEAAGTAMPGEGPDDGVGRGDEFPVAYVSRTDAEEFCRQLTESERAAGRLGSDLEYRLPTEAQWEYACRAGSTAATAFGDRFGPDAASFRGLWTREGTLRDDVPGRTTPVGSHPPNAWGLHDMHGNVAEWCMDGYDPSGALPGGVDPVFPPTPTRGVYRGGDWSSFGRSCRSAFRWETNARAGSSTVRFRVALVPLAR